MAVSRGVGPVINTASVATSVSATLTGTTAGRQVVINVMQVEAGEGFRTISGVTVGGQAATVIGGVSGTGLAGDRHSIAYLSNLSSGGDKTVEVTVSGGTQFGLGVKAQEYAGGDQTEFYDGAFASEPGGDSSGESIDLTTNSANAMIFATVVCGTTGTTIVAGSAYSLVDASDSAMHANDRIMDDLDAGAAGVKAVDATWPFSNGWLMAAAAFKVASSWPPPGSDDAPEKLRVLQSGLRW